VSPGSTADWLPIAEARERVLAGVAPLGTTPRPVSACLGYVLAEYVLSPIDLPAHDNSAMDGFAVRAEDVRGATPAAPRALAVTGDVPAGASPGEPLRAGTAVRVMTGAAVPDGADSVIRVEHTDGGRTDGSGRWTVTIASDVDAGRNIRRSGEDLRRGDPVLQPGRVIRPAELAVAASVGKAELEVVRRPAVGVLTSGDELVDVGDFDQVIAGRRIISSNTYSLVAQLAEIGIEARNLGIAADSAEALREALAGAQGCDALITSAGISMGERDLVRGVLAELGADIDFWRVKMRPGSPFAFGRLPGLGGIPWFGLPGNPVSSMVTFEVLVRPALLKMCGRSAVFAPVVAATPATELTAPADLTMFVRVRLSAEGEGAPATATLTGAQGSGILTSMAEADALLVLPLGATVAPGESATAIVLGGAPLRTTAGY
jgi:molybdopterin molybdotransferase